jgi:hypothetical protein
MPAVIAFALAVFGLLPTLLKPSGETAMTCLLPMIVRVRSAVAAGVMASPMAVLEPSWIIPSAPPSRSQP